MKAIRRSLKSDKEQSSSAQKQPHLSLTHKSATAIVPPKKVIKALYDYQPQTADGQQLAFHKGDFFHVISREDDSEWYEACNPLVTSQRGLVPVAYFEVIGKQQRQSGENGAAGGRGSAEQVGAHDSGLGMNSEYTGMMSGHARNGSKAQTGQPGQGHSRGISMTGKGGATVYGVVQYDFNAERADELEAKAGEAIIVVAQSNPEWFVAKPIGRLGGPGLIPVSFVEIKDTVTMQSVTDPLEAVRRAGVPRVEEWKRVAAQYKNNSISLGKLAGDANGSEGMTGGMGRMSLQDRQQGDQGRYPQPMQGHQQQQNIPLAPVSASVPRYCFDNDMYWYIIECQMEDGRWFELSRYYADFYDFQIALIEAFPREAGNDGKPRTLPFMPGPVAHVTDAISNGRRQNLDEYIKQILAMPPHISKSMLVRNLFKPKPSQDYEMDPNSMNEDYRLSHGSQTSMQRIQSRISNQNQPGAGYGGMPPPNQRTSHQRSQQSMNNGYPPPLHAQASNLTQKSQSSSMNQPPPITAASAAAGGGGGALKIKVFFGDDIHAIRVPQEVTFRELKQKIVERLKVGHDVTVQYKDELTESYIDMETDDNLYVALQRNPKLTLYVSYAGA